MRSSREVDFDELRRAANGMLSADVYRAIHETAGRAGAGFALEVGTAHGAATIAIAAALDDGRIVTIDRIKGGSRERFGDVDANRRMILGNFQRFGVAARIDFHVGTSSEVAPQLPAVEIGLLMLDADGAVDRDLRLFYDRLAPGAPIIIDDYEPGYVRCYDVGGAIHVEQKCRITALLVDYLESRGYLVRDRIVDRTWFGHKPHDAPLARDMDIEEICGLYHQLTFAWGRRHGRVAETIGAWTRRFPGVHFALKRLYVRARS